MTPPLLQDLREQVGNKIKSLELHREYDVIVIGVGSMGAAACYQLAKAGQNVLGIEQFDLAHSNGSHTGQSRLIRMAYGEDVRYVPLLKKAYTNWKLLEEETGSQVYFPTGIAYFGSKSNPFFDTMKSSARRHDIKLQELTSEESKLKFPHFEIPENYQHLLETEAGFLTPERCILLYTHEALKRGAHISSDTKVMEWTYESGKVKVTTDQGIFKADKLVITAGAWAGKLIPKLKNHLKVTRQVLAWVQPKKPETCSLDNFPCWYMEQDGFDYYGFPMLNYPYFDSPAGMKIALHYPGMEIMDADQVDRFVSPEENRKLIDFMNTYLPGVYERSLTMKTCLYTYSPDTNFIIDYLPDHDENVVIAAGFSGHGFKFASVVGEILSNLTTRTPADLPIDFLSVRRFAGMSD